MVASVVQRAERKCCSFVRTTCKSRYSHPIPVILVILAGVAIRWINLTAGGLWLDEIWSMRMSASENSIAEIIDACKQDTHPPLFDLLLHFWLTIFGDNDLSGRSFALLWGALGITATWFYSLRTTCNRPIAFVALALVSFNFFHIYYSNEVRFYGFLYLLSLILIGHLHFYLTRRRVLDLVVVTLVMIAALYTHYYSVFLVSSLGIAVLVLSIWKKISARQFWSVAVAGIVSVIAFIPWIPFVLRGSEAESWMQVPEVYDWFNYLYLFTGKNPLEFMFLLVFGTVGVFYFRKQPVLIVLSLSLIILGFLLPLLASWIVTPVLHERYTIIYLPAIFLLAASGFSEIWRSRWNRKMLVISLLWAAVAVNLVFIHPYFSVREKEPWKAIALELHSHVDRAPVYTEMDFWLNYYLQQSELPEARDVEDFAGETEFWLVKTPYDRKALPDFIAKNYRQLQTISYHNAYEISLMQKQESVN